MITKDGKLYSFTVNYTDQLPYQAVDLRLQENQEQTAARFSASPLNEAQLQSCAQTLLINKPFMNDKEKSNQMKLRLQGIYLAGEVLFFRFELQNKSAVGYDLDFSRFYVRDKKRIKRTAVQEQEVQPLFSYPNEQIIVDGNGKQSMVIAFEKFTIADSKDFVAGFFERNGDRHIQLKIEGKDILKAKSIPIPQP